MITEEVRNHTEQDTLATRGFLKAAERLGLKGTGISQITGVSEATVSRMKRGSCTLSEGSKSYELAMMLVRINHALGKIFSGDAATIQTWLREHQDELKGVPIDKMSTIRGLVSILVYTEVRAARS